MGYFSCTFLLFLVVLYRDKLVSLIFSGGCDNIADVLSAYEVAAVY